MLDLQGGRCAVGWLHYAAGKVTGNRYIPQKVYQYLGFPSEGCLIHFNDSHTKKDVLDVFNRAIARIT